jgi:hypothetical protein
MALSAFRALWLRARWVCLNSSVPAPTTQSGRRRRCHLAACAAGARNLRGWCPRSESNRHAFKGGGFSSHFGFRRPARGVESGSWSGARLHRSLSTLGARRLLSTPSHAFARAWLGVSSSDSSLRAFTDFDGLHLMDFSARAQVVLSESAASTNSATRASSACSRAPIRAAGAHYRGSTASRVWVDDGIRAMGRPAQSSLSYRAAPAYKCLNLFKFLHFRRWLGDWVGARSPRSCATLDPMLRVLPSVWVPHREATKLACSSVGSVWRT